VSRHGAVAAVEGRCPRCDAPRERRQEYCVDCGLRLPVLRGAVPALRRRWVRRVGWYPGDWVWPSLVTLAVAAAGAAVAITFGRTTPTTAATTSISPRAARAALPTAPGESSTKPHPTPVAGSGRATWPAHRNGWTIVLFSYPTTTGTTAAYATAARAAHAGLAEVGVVDSGQFASLHPGYYVVFSGVYSTAAEADAALRSARAAGFSSAYTRQISR
jgi:hypothetical protein